MLNLVMNKIRLLIIEEHTAVRHALQVRLQSSSNLEVLASYPCVADWDSQRLTTNDVGDSMIDVVLLGLKSSGYRPLSSTIRDIETLKKAVLAMIVLASFADEIERELILQAGAQRYLLKDINSIQLISEIESLASAATA